MREACGLCDIISKSWQKAQSGKGENQKFLSRHMVGMNIYEDLLRHPAIPHQSMLAYAICPTAVYLSRRILLISSWASIRNLIREALPLPLHSSGLHTPLVELYPDRIFLMQRDKSRINTLMLQITVKDTWTTYLFERTMEQNKVSAGNAKKIQHRAPGSWLRSKLIVFYV